MRPAEIGPAIVKAAENYLAELRRLATEDPQLVGERKGATLAELAERACVGRQCARHMVPKLVNRDLQLQVVGTRRVPYRNRPVNEYAPADSQPDLLSTGPRALASCLQDWAR